ncbi:MAG: hypothetical protein HYZ53_12380 [Planctomycetes bacterium]|nr:hypothetical protein [Planctomycetota bacterium]
MDRLLRPPHPHRNNVVAIADFAELECFRRRDRSVSALDIARLLRRGGANEEVGPELDGDVRQIVDEAFEEIEERERATGPNRRNYPFAVSSTGTLILLRRRAAFRYVSEPPKSECLVLHRDMRELPWLRAELPKPIRCVVTSPPYFDVTNFEEDQWLRLWFLGGPPAPTRGRLSRDDRHGLLKKYCGFLTDMWRALGGVVATRGHVVIRIGSTRLSPEKLVGIVTGASRVMQRSVRLGSTEVSALRNRQTERFRPGSKGCMVEVDCHFQFVD